MIYPILEINLNKIHHNTRVLVEQCRKQGVEITAVTKSFCGNPEIAQVIANAGVTALADSRIQNIKKMLHIPLPKLLLRIPMLSEIDELIEYVDISINSEVETIKKISEAACKKGKMHRILLIIDLGDLREGFMEEQIISAVGEIIDLEGIHLEGLAVNFGCYGGIIPEKHSLEKLISIKNEIEALYPIDLHILSGGNSNSLHLIWENKLPKGINQLRLGQSIIFGKEDVYNKTIEGLYADAFKLFVEIVEIKDKPSVPIGKRGIDAFGKLPTFEERGIRKRAIVAIGRQDIMLNGIVPKEIGVTVIGASSDHLILDITEATRQLKIGDVLELEMNYGALLTAMTSEYVYKKIISQSI
ncbi:MAG: alanine/ornithine racemase family PLP-dependent enzyme [Alkaliphilus sp.]|nr:alanine/ornithine racemase family PLP-dependent enzyme [Alkaliphilus sp.]